MYNLAHIYLYGEFIKEDIDKSIDLLIKSSNKDFRGSFIWLCLAIIKKVTPLNEENIQSEIEKHDIKSSKLAKSVFNYIKFYQVEMNFQFIFQLYKNIEFIYDHENNALSYLHHIKYEKEDILQKKKANYEKYNLTKSFYEGYA